MRVHASIGRKVSVHACIGKHVCLYTFASAYLCSCMYASACALSLSSLRKCPCECVPASKRTCRHLHVSPYVHGTLACVSMCLCLLCTLAHRCLACI